MRIWMRTGLRTGTGIRARIRTFANRVQAGARVGPHVRATLFVRMALTVAVIMTVAAAALASLHAWQAVAPPPRAAMVNDDGTDNPLFDMGGTFYTVESRAVRVKTRFARGTAIAERAPDGDIRAGLTDAFGNAKRELVVDATGAMSSRLDVRDEQGSIVESAVTRAEVRPTLDWANLQLHAIDTDARGPREWRGRFLRSKAARRVNLDDEPLEVETEFETGLRSKTTKVTDKRAGVIYRTTVYDGGTEVGWMAWRPQSKTLAFDFKGLTSGVITEKTLEAYGGWRFRPTLSWANLQGFAYYDFGVRLRTSGPQARNRTVPDGAPEGRSDAAARARTAREGTAREGTAREGTLTRAAAAVVDRSSVGGGLLQRFTDLFVTTVYANEEGCDRLHWLDGSMFRYCCDRHDLCYEKNGCSEKSWWSYGGWSCTRCNLQAVVCFTTIEAEDLDSGMCQWIHWHFNWWPPGCGGN
jgi:hypothetical protein